MDTCVQALRSLLLDDVDIYERNLAEVNERGAADVYGALLVATLIELLSERFPNGLTDGAAIRYVATLRLNHMASPNDLDPMQAERMINGLFGDVECLSDMTDEVKADVQVKLLLTVADDLNLSDKRLDDAVGRAQNWVNVG